MALLQNYPIVRQLLEAVGLSVFHTLWAGCILLVLLFVVLKVIPTRLAKARFTASLLTLQLLFLLFLAVFFYQWDQLAPPPNPIASTITAPAPTTTMALPSVPTTAEVNVPRADVPRADVPREEAPWLTLLNQWSLWLAMVWLLGGVFHAIQLLLGVQHTRQLRAHAQPLSGDWEDRFARLKQCLGIKQQVMFWESAQTAVPLTFGWLKPVVLIPVGLLTQLSPEQVEMIVLHELAHIRRYDYFWSLSQSVAEIVLFYHPAYWYIAQVLEREREFACDQMTIRVTQQPQTYARTLLQVATTTAAPAYGLAASGKRGLSARIKRIVAPASGRRNIQVLPALILIGFLGLASVTFALQLQPPGFIDSHENQEEPADSTGRDYGPSFKEVMSQVPDETLDTTSLTLGEIYDSTITINQSLNRRSLDLENSVAFRKSGLPISSINYSSPEVLYLVDGQVRDPKSVKMSEIGMMSISYQPEKKEVKGIDMRNYVAVVEVRTKKDMDESTDQNTSSQTDRWLYIVNDQVQASRPAFLDQDYRANGWETRVVPGSSWWIKDHLTEKQQAAVDEYKHTGIVFITSQSYRASQPKHLIYGTVVKGRDELPVPNILVRIKGKNISTTTDANGYYQLTATHWQDTVEFLLDYYVTKIPINGRREIGLITTERSRSRERVQKRMQRMLKNIEQKLQAKNSDDSVLLTGQVHNWFTNEYVPKVNVIANGSTTTATDADGRYQFRFPAGTEDVSLTFSAPGYPMRDMEVDMTGRNHFHAVMSMVREDEKATTEELQAQPAQDSAAGKALTIVDGIPQYGKIWKDLNLSLAENIQSLEVLSNRDGSYRYFKNTEDFNASKNGQGVEVSEAVIPKTISKEQQQEWLAEGYEKVVLIKTKQGPVATKTLVMVDGVPQYGKTLNEVDQELRENPLYDHFSLTSHGADSSQAILKALRAEGYNKVVRIDSWASKKKDGMIDPSHLEQLVQVFPNPTQDWFTLQFHIGEKLPITITVLDEQGQPLTTLTDQTYPAGLHEVGWDASDQKPGVYFVQWIVGEQRVTRKVVIE